MRDLECARYGCADFDEIRSDNFARSGIKWIFRLRGQSEKGREMETNFYRISRSSRRKDLAGNLQKAPIKLASVLHRWDDLTYMGENEKYRSFISYNIDVPHHHIPMIDGKIHSSLRCNPA